MKKKDTPKEQEEKKPPLKIQIEGREVEVNNFTTDEAGQTHQITLNAKQALKIKLVMYAMTVSNAQLKAELEELIEILDYYVVNLKYKLNVEDDTIRFDYDLVCKPVGEGITEEESKQEALSKMVKFREHYMVTLAIHELNGTQEYFLNKVEEVQERAKEAEQREKEALQKAKEAEEQLKELEKQLKKAKTGKFRKSADLTDQMLMYTYPKDKTSQLPIWGKLQEKTKKLIESSNVQITEVVEGIRLSPSQQKVIDTLCKLLHERSQTSNPQQNDYYSGNAGYSLTMYGDQKNVIAPQLSFTLYELTQEYKGGEAVSGKDMENVRSILQELDEKKFLLSLIEATTIKGGEKLETKIEDFRKLIHIIKITQTYSKDNNELSRQEETVVALNPIFRRQIHKKFIEYPSDINRRTIIAYGNHNVSEITMRLRDDLIRMISNKEYTYQIYQERLYYKLAEKWMRESRKAKVKLFTEKAISTCIELGIINSYEIKPGETGERKYVFKLNKNWI